MGLKANNEALASGPKQELVEPANYPARVVQVIDLGVQEQRPFQGKPKPPAHEIMVTYELVTEFCKDEDGNDMEDKPRWMSETFVLYPRTAERSKSAQRLKSIDPTDEVGGDFSQLIGWPCNVTVVHNPSKTQTNDDGTPKVYANIGSVTQPMKGMQVPELVNPPNVLDLDDPDLEAYERLPEWVQEKICKNLNYEGSALQTALTGNSEASQGQEKEHTENTPEDNSVDTEADDDGSGNPW